MQKFHVGQRVRFTMLMERALRDVPKRRLTSEGIVTKAWLRMGEVQYTVRLDTEVLSMREASTDGSRLEAI